MFKLCCDKQDLMILRTDFHDNIKVVCCSCKCEIVSHGLVTEHELAQIWNLKDFGYNNDIVDQLPMELVSMR